MSCPHCAAMTTTGRTKRTGLGYRTFRCFACWLQSYERTGTPFNNLAVPTDIVLLIVLWRVRYELSRRDIAEMILVQGVEFSHGAVRAWEAPFPPLMVDQRRSKRKGQAGHGWHCVAERDNPRKSVELQYAS